MNRAMIIPDSELEALSTPPHFNVDVTLNFHNALPPDLLAMWRERCTPGKLPARSDFDVLDMRNFMGWLCIAEVTPDREDLVYRLIGTRVVENVGRDMTGAVVSETLPAPALQIFRHLMNDPRPVRTWGDVGWRNKEFRHHESLVLPLAADGQVIDRFFVMMMFFNRKADATG